MHPLILWDLGHILGADEFVKLAAHLQLRSKDSMDVSVGGRGVVHAGDVEGSELHQGAMHRARATARRRSSSGLQDH